MRIGGEVLLIILILTLQSTSFAQSSPVSTIPADDCRAVLGACNAAAEELRAARTLIDALKGEIAVMREKLSVDAERLSLIAEKNQALQEQAEALREAVEARKEAQKAAEALLMEYRERVAKLEDDRAKARRRMIIASVASVIFGFLISK